MLVILVHRSLSATEILFTPNGHDMLRIAAHSRWRRDNNDDDDGDGDGDDDEGVRDGRHHEGLRGTTRDYLLGPDGSN